MNLTFLSMQRVRRGRALSRPPSNEDRVAAYRAFQPPVLGNAYPWTWRDRDLARHYELDAIADSAPDSTE